MFSRRYKKVYAINVSIFGVDGFRGLDISSSIVIIVFLCYNVTEKALEQGYPSPALWKRIIPF